MKFDIKDLDDAWIELDLREGRLWVEVNYSFGNLQAILEPDQLAQLRAYLLADPRGTTGK